MSWHPIVKPLLVFHYLLQDVTIPTTVSFEFVFDCLEVTEFTRVSWLLELPEVSREIHEILHGRMATVSLWIKLGEDLLCPGEQQAYARHLVVFL